MSEFPSFAPDARWESIGPINVIEHPQIFLGEPGSALAGRTIGGLWAGDGAIFVVGDGGGLWRSRDSGRSWTHLTRAWLHPEVRSVCQAGEVLLAGLGSGRGGSGGVRRSMDGGQSWESALYGADTMGAGTVFALAADERAAAIAAALGRGRRWDGGLYCSEDGGRRWREAHRPPDTAWDTLAPGAADASGRRWLFAAGTSDLKRPDGRRRFALARSGDGGRTWEALPEPPKPPKLERWDRAFIAASPLFSETVYVAASNRQPLYKSEDGGLTWQPLFCKIGGGEALACGQCNGQDFLLLGGFSLYGSFDGGKSFGELNIVKAKNEKGEEQESWRIHCDQHGFAFHPSDSSRLLLFNDGGVYEASLDRAKKALSFRSLGARLGNYQLYSLTPHLTDRNRALAASQDNSGVGALQTLGSWRLWTTGDGMASALSPADPTRWYFCLQAGETTDFWTLAGHGRDARYSQPRFTGRREKRHFFYISIAAGKNPDRVYTASNFLHRRDEPGGQWQRMPFNLSPAGGRVSALAIAPENGNLIYAATDRGEVWRSDDGGQRWRALHPAGGAKGTQPLPRRPVTSLAVAPSSPERLYVTFGGSGAHVWTCESGAGPARTWTTLDGTGRLRLPDLPVYRLAPDPRRPETLYLATERGVYVTDDHGVTWRAASAILGMPVIWTQDVAIGAGYLWAATYGVGGWRIPLAGTPLPDTRRFRVR